MAKIKTIQLKDLFARGISPNSRGQDGFYMLKNFDIYSDSSLLIPFMKNTAENVKTYDIVKQLFYNGKYYGLGVDVSTTKPQVFEKSSITATWTASTTAKATSAGARDENLFMVHKGIIWGARAGSHLWSYVVATNTFDEADEAVTYTGMAQGVVGKKDGVAYVPYYNTTNAYVATLATTTWDLTALNLGTDRIPVSISEFGNYIAIACVPRDTYKLGNSSVVIWDRVSSNFYEIVDWGSERLYSICEYEGQLFGLSTYEVSTTRLVSQALTFKSYSLGGMPVVVKRFAGNINLTDTAKALLYNVQNQVHDGRIFFAGSISKGGDNNIGIYSFGRKSTNSPYVLTLECDIGYSVQGFLKSGDDFLFSYNDDGSTGYNHYTTGNYDDYATAVLETNYFGSDETSNKSMVKIEISHLPILSGGTLKVEYRTPADTWVELKTNSTANSVVTEIVRNIKLVPEFRLRITSTGRTTLTGIKLSYESGD